MFYRVHPPVPRCVTQRIMTDNIFEIETAAIATADLLL